MSEELKPFAERIGVDPDQYPEKEEAWKATWGLLGDIDVHMNGIDAQMAKDIESFNLLRNSENASLTQITDTMSRIEARFAEERRDRPSSNPFKRNDGTWNQPFIIAASVLTALSIGGSSFAKIGATEATMSLTAALQGLHEGNKERYEREMKEYQQRMQEIEHSYERDIKRLFTIYNDKRKDMETKHAEIRALAIEKGHLQRDQRLIVKDLLGKMLAQWAASQRTANTKTTEASLKREAYNAYKKREAEAGRTPKPFELWDAEASGVKAGEQAKEKAKYRPKTVSEMVTESLSQGKKKEVSDPNKRTGAGW